MAAPQFDNIPQEYKDRAQWVLWKTITRAGRHTKVPYRPNGIEADSSDPATWSSFADVVAAYEKGGYDGIGYVFDVLDPYAGVDMDHCINEDGTIKPKAKAILDKLNTYSEVSPSGTGIKVFPKAKNPVSIRKKNGKFQQGFNSKKPDLEIEIYYGNRFFTLTGNRLDQYSHSVEDRHEELTGIFRDVFADRGYFDRDDSTSVPTGEPLSDDAAERLQELFAADPTFKADLTTPAPVGKRSDAEFHLCARLWEAGFVEAEIYQIMTSSPQTMPLAMSKDHDSIFYFSNDIYKQDGARVIDKSMCDVAGDAVTGDKLKETLRRIRNDLLETPVTFDPDPWVIGVKNGVADLLTGKVREYHSEDLITDQIDVTYESSAKCPAFLDFLESITPNVSDRITLIDWFVATAIKEPLAYVLFLLGLGRNGKGIYEKLIKKFFGQSAFRDMPLAEVSRNNFAASGFYKKRGWIASETGKRKAAIGTDFMKLTSGNGVIDGDRKNQSRIQFEPYFQTIVDTNTMPQIEDSSIGWMERFVKVDLPYIFIANPGKTNTLEKQRDPCLFGKLSTPGELSGILNLLLFRSQAIGKSKAIHKRSGSEMFAEYAEQSSSVKAFLDAFCEYDGALSGLRTPSEPIYAAYKEWCGYKVGEVVDKAYFGKQLKKFCGGVEPKRGKDKETRKSTTTYQGLIYDSSKCEAALDALRLSMSQDVSGMSQGNLKEGEDIQGQKITMSQVSQGKLWNEIMEKFGNPQKEDKSSPKREKANLPETLAPPETSTASNGVGGKLPRDILETLPETGIGPHPRRDEPTPTKRVCAKCGADLTGHATVERGGKAYCALPGCGYPEREKAEAT